MPRLILKAFVLKADYIFEIDREVVLFTEERGKLTTIGRGGAKIPNRFGSALTPFTLIEATVWESWKGGLTLETAEIVKPGFPLFSSPENYFFLSIILEVLLNLLPENLKREKIFHLLEHSIDNLQKNPIAASSYFLFWAMKLEGFPIDKNFKEKELFREPPDRFFKRKIPLKTFTILARRTRNFLEKDLHSLSEMEFLLKIR